MEIRIEKSFYKDLSAIKNRQTALDVESIILKIEAATSLSQIHNIKKLKGDATAYRIKYRDYRIGLFIENNIVDLVRFLHRKDIYRQFPPK